jgi:hypothetical protein
MTPLPPQTPNCARCGAELRLILEAVDPKTEKPYLQSEARRAQEFGPRNRMQVWANALGALA